MLPKLDLILLMFSQITIILNPISTVINQSAHTIPSDLNEVTTKYYEVKLNELVSDDTSTPSIFYQYDNRKDQIYKLVLKKLIFI